MNKKWRLFRLSSIWFLAAFLLAIVFATPSYAHWADLSVAEIVVGETQTKIALTFPTGLVASADDNRDGELSPTEVRTHKAEIEAILRDRIRLTDNFNRNGSLTIQPSAAGALPPNLKVTAGTHSTLQLVYSWQLPVQGLKIHYDFFLPGVPTAHCLATIVHGSQVQNFIFRPDNRDLALMPGNGWLGSGSFLMAIAGSFVWGAMHAMSPGHGKTIVGAYLVGSRATVQHALFLGLTTTITHTIGVFALGLVALFASQYIIPEQLYPWLSLISGLMVVTIGLNLFLERLSSAKLLRKSPFEHSHAEEHHPHEHPHPHPHEHSHEHKHHQHQHSHLPPGAEGEPVTWRSLLALGISGGIVPCPSALVVLLSAIALGNIGSGLVLVLAFSLGLAVALTGVGLLLLSAKRLFERMPTRGRLVRGLPAASALFITLLGLGITTQALMQIGL